MIGSHRGKTYLVTGAASGIGASTVALLKGEGAKVVGVDVRPNESCDEFFVADLGDPAAIDNLVAQLPANLNGLANVAGVPPTRPPQTVLRVNFLGPRRLTLALLDKLEPGASIVNVASLAGVEWSEHVNDVRKLLAADFADDLTALGKVLGLDRGARSYFLTKEALIYWTMLNRWTWRDRRIRMNCVSPGPVMTPIYEDFQATLGERAEEDARLMDRPAVPEDIAPIIAFMLSDASAWIRGANIPADGGMLAHVQTARVS